MSFISTALWIVFAFAMSNAGINIVDDTFDYLIITFIVIAIILNEKFEFSDKFGRK